MGYNDTSAALRRRDTGASKSVPDQLEIAYCDACGKRLTPDDFAVGDAVRTSDGRTFCERCAPKAQAFLAGQGAGAAPARAGGSGSRIPSIEGRKRPPSGFSRKATSRRRVAHRSSSRRPRVDEGERSGIRNLFIVAAVLAVIAFAVLSLLMREPPPEPAPPSTAGRPEPEPEPAPTPDPVSALKPKPTPKPKPPATGGLVGHWKFEDDKWLDSSGNGNTLKAVGKVTVEPGRVGNAARLDEGSCLFIEHAKQKGLDVKDALTLSLWIKPDRLGGHRYLIDRWKHRRDEQDKSSYRFRLAGPGLQFVMVAGEKGKSLDTTARNFLPGARRWSHVAAVFDGREKTVRFYLNGEPRGEVAKVTSGVLRDSDAPLAIGAAFTGERTQQTMVGLIDEVRVYSRVLSAEEIKALVDADTQAVATPTPPPPPPPPATGGLVGHWKFDDAKNPGRDSSPAGNHLTAHGEVTVEKGRMGPGAARLPRESYFSLEPGGKNAPDLTGSFTLVGWMNLSGLGVNVIAAKGSNAGEDSCLQVSASRKWVAIMLSEDGKKMPALWGQASIEKDRWYHFAAVYDAGGRRKRVYLDGKPLLSRNENQRTAPPRLHASAAPLLIGASSPREKTVYYLNGVLDDLRLYNRVLSVGEIKALAGE